MIDTSGSMSLGADQIKEIVLAVPAAVIGTYGAPSLYSGALRILSKHGTLVVQEKEFASVGSSNGVDGPALRWLGLQPRPRIWISDGVVTGVVDIAYQSLTREAMDICERFRIRRVGTLEEARRLL